MNCDQAFERLTDPQLNGDSELQDHLDRCPRCRDMAEILEPALRFVTGDGSQEWSTSAWEFPTKLAEKTEQPFLTEQAVRVAENAATSLLARKSRHRRAQRNRWLALLVLAPMVALALFLAEPDNSRMPQSMGYHPSGPALGPCTRASAAMAATADDEDREISAYEVVRACNVCHLLDRLVRRDERDHLKLQPVKTPDTGSLWQVAPGKAQVSTGISLRWQMASVALQTCGC